MATTKDWSSEQAPVQLGLYFATGDATAWCVHTAPSWARKITVYNAGSGELRVSCPQAAGNWAATDDYQPLPAGAACSWTISTGPSAPPAAARAFGTYGADGATHVVRITFEAAP